METSAPTCITSNPRLAKAHQLILNGAIGMFNVSNAVCNGVQLHGWIFNRKATRLWGGGKRVNLSLL